MTTTEQEIRRMYPKAFRELTRVLRPNGSLVFLATERNVIRKVIAEIPVLYAEMEREIRVGGMLVFLYHVRKMREEEIAAKSATRLHALDEKDRERLRRISASSQGVDMS
jgi:ubiquinone/menaquinone biosynthesis C-methylase UbiE